MILNFIKNFNRNSTLHIGQITEKSTFQKTAKTYVFLIELKNIISKKCPQILGKNTSFFDHFLQNA